MKIINSTLHPEFIADLIHQNYALGVIVESVFLSLGVNDSYMVATESSRYVARLYRHGWRNHPEIDFEVDFVTYLASRSGPVARFIPARDGSVVQGIFCPEGERYLVLMECASDSVYQDHAVISGDAHHYGKSVGLLHVASQGFAGVKPRKVLDTQELIWKPLAAVTHYFPTKVAEISYLQQFATRLVDEIEKLDKEGLNKMYIHGDLTGGNANRDSAGRYTFFDFDCCGLGWQAYDLAVFRWSLLQNNKAELWPECLAGYKSVTEIGQIDESAIDLFAAARNFWIMGYSLARVKSLGMLSYKESLLSADVEFFKRSEPPFQ